MGLGILSEELERLREVFQGDAEMEDKPAEHTIRPEQLNKGSLVGRRFHGIGRKKKKKERWNGVVKASGASDSGCGSSGASPRLPGALGITQPAVPPCCLLRQCCHWTFRPSREPCLLLLPAFTASLLEGELRVRSCLWVTCRHDGCAQGKVEYSSP